MCDKNQINGGLSEIDPSETAQQLQGCRQSFQGVTTMELYMATYSFDTDDAIEHGIDGAIVLYNLCFWIRKNQANKRNFFDGHWWTYNSTKAFTELFPFWNTQKIGRIIRRLEASGAIKSGNYNKSGYDKTKWYTVLKSHCLNMNNGTINNEQPIPDVNTDEKTQIEADASPSLEKPSNQKQNTPEQEKEIPAPHWSERKRKALDLWLQFKKEKRQGYKPTGIATFIKTHDDWDDLRFEKAVEYSISNNWQGLFEDDKKPKPGNSSGPNYGLIM